MVANAVKEQPVTLWTPADDFEALAANQMLIGRTPGAAVEHHGDLEERNKISMSGQMRTLKLDYKEDRNPTGREYWPGPQTGINVGVQRLGLLGPTNEVEPPSESDEKKCVTEDVNVPEEMLGDTATQESESQSVSRKSEIQSVSRQSDSQSVSRQSESQSVS